MGFFKDIRGLQKQAEAMTPPEHRGVMGGFRAMKDGVAQANQMLGDLGEEQAKAERLMSVGMVGQATINNITDTGVTVNDNPKVNFDLTVSLPGQQPYQAALSQVVSRIVIGNFQPGATVPVRVDPENPQSLMIA